MVDYIRESAYTQHGDYRGTASGDGAMVNDVKHLSELAGLSEGQLPVGIDFGWAATGNMGVNVDIHVLVYEPENPDEANMTALLEKYPEGEDVPVKDILLHDVSLEQFMLAFTQFDIKLSSRFFTGRQMRVVESSDFPKQD